jgi:predicted alpha/beta superfamily hydrolase
VTAVRAAPAQPPGRADTAAAATPAPLVRRVRSAALDEVREYTVRLPEGYGRAGRRFPVVYVLDGPPLDGHTEAAARVLARRGEAPGLIVVGIPNMRRGERARDFLPPAIHFALSDGSSFTGGADRFLRFLRDDLIPRVEGEFRTASPRLVVGHSLGAIFVTWSLTVAPELFAARFAHSPAIWRDEDLVVDGLSRWLAATRDSDRFLYLSVGANEGTGMQSGYHKLQALLATRAAGAGLRWHAAITPDAVHETNVERASLPALRAFFTPSRSGRPGGGAGR